MLINFRTPLGPKRPSTLAFRATSYVCGGGVLFKWRYSNTLVHYITSGLEERAHDHKNVSYNRLLK